MTSCSGFQKILAPTTTPDGTLQPGVPGQVGTRLITRQTDPVALTGNQETDCRTALTRGLAEYLSQLSVEILGDRLLRFKSVFSEWAEPESLADYPSAVIYGVSEGVYDESKFTPFVQAALPDGRFLMTSAEYVSEFSIEIWATDPKERFALVAMLEEAFNPVDWRYGVLLELPHYFNERASYELLRMVYTDTELEAMQRYRKATLFVKGIVPTTRISNFALSTIRKQVTVT
jgi:hypothetical protein